MRHLPLLALVLAFTACSKKSGDSGAPGSGGSGGSGSGGAEAPAGLDGIKVEIAGKPIPIARAFIKRIPVDGRYQLFVSDKGGSCTELLDNSFDHMSDNAVLFDVGPKLQPDNKTIKTEVTALYSGGDTAKVTPGSSVAISGNADKGTKVDVTIDADITVEGSTRPGAIGIHGKLVAEGCGARAETDTSGIPKAAHPSKATMTIGGTRLPIAGAIFKGTRPEPRDGVEQQRNLFLSTGPKDCSGTTPWSAFQLEREWRAWKLGGEYLAAKKANDSMIDKDGQPETKGLTVTLGAKGESADGPTIQIELSGAGTIGGVAVELTGPIEAIDCPE